MHKFLISLGHAIDGLKEMLAGERNFRIQIVLGAAAFSMCLFLRVSSTEWAIISLAVGLALGSEALNSSVERFVDSMINYPDARAKRAKDASAAAALICALAALACGIAVFLPKLLAIFFN